MADGEDDQPKRERFNTQYLVSQIHTEQKRTKMIGIVVAGVLALILIYVLFIRQPSPEVPPGGVTPTAVAPPPVPGTPPTAPGVAPTPGAAPAPPAQMPIGAAPPKPATPPPPAH